MTSYEQRTILSGGGVTFAPSVDMNFISRLTLPARLHFYRFPPHVARAPPILLVTANLSEFLIQKWIQKTFRK